MSDENVGGLVELPDRVLAFLSQHGGWDAALAYVHKIEVENRLRANAVDRWVPCPDHRDKTERGKCYVCENERLTKSLSAHGQPVVGEARPMDTYVSGLALLWMPEFDHYAASWWKGSVISGITRLQTPLVQDDKQLWLEMTDMQPLGWMPLPEPPTFLTGPTP